MKRLLLAPLLFVTTVSTVFAQVTVKDPWVRATVPAQTATGAFMQLNAVTGARLVEARSPVARTVELHEMAMVNNVMKMRAIPGIELPAGKTVDLGPGGYHVMLIGLKKQIKEGDTVPITLVVAGKDGRRETIEVAAPVRPLHSASGEGVHMH